MGQTEMWTTTENWISKQKHSQIILQGDLNGAHPGADGTTLNPSTKI